MSSPFPLESKIAVFHRFVVASWKLRLCLVPKPLRSRPAKPSRVNPRLAANPYIFHEATTNQWKTAILLSSGKGDDITFHESVENGPFRFQVGT